MNTLSEQLDICARSIGKSTPVFEAGDYLIQLRRSRPTWPVVVNGETVRYKTLDIVSISHAPYARGDIELGQIPKDGAADLYKQLEEYASSRGLALRIENVLSPVLRAHYIEKKGFLPEVNAEFTNEYNTSVIKILENSQIIKD